MFEVVYGRQGSGRRVLAARNSDCYGCPSFKGGGDFGSNQHFTGWGPDLLEQRKRVGHRGSSMFWAMGNEIGQVALPAFSPSLAKQPAEHRMSPLQTVCNVRGNKILSDKPQPSPHLLRCVRISRLLRKPLV